MKKLFLSLFAIILCSTAFASSPWYPEKGKVLEYEVKDGKDRVTAYAQTSVRSLVDMGFQTRLEVETQAFDKNKKPQGDPIIMAYNIMNDNMITDLTSLFPDQDEVTFTFRGDDIISPLTIEVGDKLPLYHLTVLADFQDPTTGIWYNEFEVLTMSTSRREVTAKETIETPAGTFECFKIEQTATVGNEMSGMETANESSWYADGIGAVKTETYDRKGNIKTVTTLISVTE